MTILNVNYRQFEEYHFVFAQMNAARCIGGQNKITISLFIFHFWF